MNQKIFKNCQVSITQFYVFIVITSSNCIICLCLFIRTLLCLQYYGLFAENLQYLRLGDNNLHTIPSDSLRRLHRLRHLDLKANNISFISEDAFTGFGDSITFLNLQKNEWVSSDRLVLRCDSDRKSFHPFYSICVMCV